MAQKNDSELSKFKVDNTGIKFSPPAQDVQKAKDFIWKYIDPPNQELIIHQMQKVENGTNTLSIKSVTIGYQYH